MLTDDKKRLKIFSDGVKINKKLPKYTSIVIKKNDKSIGNVVNGLLPSFNLDKINPDELKNFSVEELNEFLENNEVAHYVRNVPSDLNMIFTVPPQRSNHKITPWMQTKNIWRTHFKFLYYRLCNMFRNKKLELSAYDVLDFFKLVKLKTEERQTYVDRVNPYILRMKRAIQNGQTSLAEQYFKNIVFCKYDALLHAKGYDKVINENDIVEFAKKTKKGVSLTYIANYIRHIPEDVCQKLEEVNSLHVFDNYVILHYDPQKTAYKETVEEKERRKDPILFGVCNGCDKLYFIADWVDEYCDLTLEEFADTIGSKISDFEKETFTQNINEE